MNPPALPLLREERRRFHVGLLNEILWRDAKGIPSIADGSSRISREIAGLFLDNIQSGLEFPVEEKARLSGQRAGNRFEELTFGFVEKGFSIMKPFRPGTWHVRHGVPSNLGQGIAAFDQYAHLRDLEELAKSSPELAAALGNDYLIKPDVVVYREPPELHGAIQQAGHEDSLELLDTMIQGKRLRDIADLPLDLVL